jgi:hypothetical protein
VYWTVDIFAEFRRGNLNDGDHSEDLNIEGESFKIYLK